MSLRRELLWQTSVTLRRRYYLCHVTTHGDKNKEHKKLENAQQYLATCIEQRYNHITQCPIEAYKKKRSSRVYSNRKQTEVQLINHNQRRVKLTTRKPKKS